MDINIVKPRHVDENIGLSALSPHHSKIFFDWLNDPRIFRGMGDFDAYPFGIQDAEKYVLAHLKDTWLIVSKDEQDWIPLDMLACLLDKGIVLEF